MREFLNHNTLFATVAMVRKDLRALILVVEGDDDHLAIKPHAGPDLVVLPGTGGRPNVLAAAELAEENSVTGVLFLVDSDYDGPLGRESKPPSNVVWSEYHDVFVDMIVAAPSVLDRVLDAHARTTARKGQVAVESARVRHDSAELAAIVARFRIANDRHSLGLNFHQFPFGALSTKSPALEEVEALILGRSNSALATGELLKLVDYTQIPPSVSPWMLVGDHDLFRALARVLKESGISVSGDTLFTSFLGALGCVSISLTTWFRLVSEWAGRHGLGAFKCPCHDGLRGEAVLATV